MPPATASFIALSTSLLRCKEEQNASAEESSWGSTCKAGGRGCLSGQDPRPSHVPRPLPDDDPALWSSMRANLMAKPHSSTVPSLMVPTHCQSVPDTGTRKASVRDNPRPQLQPPCSHVDRGQRAFSHSGSQALGATKREPVKK